LLIFSPLIFAALETAGEQEEFLLLYHRHRNLMFTRANDILRNEYDAEDAVQEALARVADNFRKISRAPCHSQKGYMVQTVENVAKSMYVKHKKDRTRQIPFEDVEYNQADEILLEDDVLAAMEAETALRLIGTLPEADRDVLILRFIHDFNDREISRHLHISNDAARKRLERAKRRLIMLWRKEKVYAV